MLKSTPQKKIKIAEAIRPGNRIAIANYKQRKKQFTNQRGKDNNNKFQLSF